MTITRRWQAGLEIDTTNSHAIEFVNPSNAIASATQAYTGAYSLRLNGNCRAIVPITGTLQARTGLFIRCAGCGGAGNLVSFMTNGGSALFVVSVSNPSTLTISSGGTARATWGGFGLNAWCHLGVDVKCHASAGWITLYIDGNQVATWSGNTGATNIDLVKYGSETSSSGNQLTAYTYMDDLYIDDTSGEVAAAVVPSYRFGFVTPNGNGNYSQCAGSDGNSVNNYQQVDEQPNDGDTSYNKATAADQHDTYAMTSYTIPTSHVVTSVIPVAICKKGAAVDIKIHPMIRENAADWEGTAVATTTGYGNVLYERRTTAPDGDPWDQTNTDAMEVGFGSSGTFA